MFDTICFEHWRSFTELKQFDMFACTHDDCVWCELDAFVLDKQADRRFIRNVNRLVDKLKLDKLMRTRTIFLISE